MICTLKGALFRPRRQWGSLKLRSIMTLQKTPGRRKRMIGINGSSSYLCIQDDNYCIMQSRLQSNSSKNAAGKQGKDSKDGGSRSGSSSGSGSSGNGSKESFRITPRSEDYFTWYSDVLSGADMIDASPVRGCMVIKPWGMGIWDLLRDCLDKRIKETGTENAYFPLFIPMSYLTKEAEHVEGFAKECAVVTHHRLKAIKTPPSSSSSSTASTITLIPDPAAELEEPLVIRPTSETIIWSMFSKWVVSHRDLPMKINQWANVVRWEMRTRPFLRTSEFLWQEGHTAHANEAEARALTREILDLYFNACRETLALPTIRGVKSPSERFAGAEETYTIEAMMQNGWALQSGTSHFLGQNFSKAFDVSFIDPSASNNSKSNSSSKSNSNSSKISDNDSNNSNGNSNGNRVLAWATSWGVSTRLIGAMVMTHADDKGLVLPPGVAPTQVVIVPISPSAKDGDADLVLAYCNQLQIALKSKGVRTKVDSRDSIRPGSKFFEWERKGVPIRIDIGPRDLAAKVSSMAIRYDGTKVSVDLDEEKFTTQILETLEQIQVGMLANAEKHLQSRIFRIDSYEQMKDILKDEKSPEGARRVGFFLVPWKCNAQNEELIKQECKATIRCYPLEECGDVALTPLGGRNCFYSGEKATHWALFARNF